MDATAGLGRDAFVLASLGCAVRLVERSPVAAALLADALTRAHAHPDTADIAARMTVIHADASDWLASLASEARPQVVFVDPMFPDTGNKAAKKTCRRFREVIGGDDDSPGACWPPRWPRASGGGQTPASGRRCGRPAAHQPAGGQEHAL